MTKARCEQERLRRERERRQRKLEQQRELEQQQRKLEQQRELEQQQRELERQRREQIRQQRKLKQQRELKQQRKLKQQGELERQERKLERQRREQERLRLEQERQRPEQERLRLEQERLRLEQKRQRRELKQQREQERQQREQERQQLEQERLRREQEHQRREQMQLDLNSIKFSRQAMWEKVVEVCLVWLERSPGKLDAMSRLARAYYHLGQLEEAKKLYEALSLRTYLGEAYINAYKRMLEKINLALGEAEKSLVAPKYREDTGIFLEPNSKNDESWIDQQWFEKMGQEFLRRNYAFSVDKLKDYKSQCWQEIKSNRHYQIPSQGRAEILASDKLIELIGLRKIRFVQEGANAPEVFLRFEFGALAGTEAVVGVVKVKYDGSVEGFHQSVDSALFQAIIEATALSYYRDLVTPGKTYSYKPGNRPRRATPATPAKSKTPRKLPRRQGIPISKHPGSSLNVWYDAQERARHDVVGHKRWIGKDFKADKATQEEARKGGVKLPDGYTWVKKHERGHSEKGELKLDGTDLTERMLFSAPERASRELEKLL